MTNSLAKSARLLLWLLAILVPSQPVLSFDCPCNCRAQEVENGQDQVLADSSCALCQGCCKANREQRVKTKLNKVHRATAAQSIKSRSKLGLIGNLPCRCADDCDCHFRHEVRLGVIEDEHAEFGFNFHSAIQGFEVVAWKDCILAALSDSPFIERDTSKQLSALEICAHFCRFTI